MCLRAIDSKGVIIVVVAEDKGWGTEKSGEASLSLDYEMKDFHPGNWMLLLGHGSELHSLSIQFPKVIRPSDDPATWKVDFKAANEYEKSVEESTKK